MKNWKKKLAAVTAGLVCIMGLPKISLVLSETAASVPAAAAEYTDDSTAEGDSSDSNLEYRYCTKTTTTSNYELDAPWILESTETGYTAWSDWSDWSTSAVDSSDICDVETESRQETASYNMVNYRTRGDYSVDSHVQYRDYSVNGNYSAYGLQASFGEYHGSEIAYPSQIASAKTVAPGEWAEVVEPESNYDGYNKGNKTGYILNLDSYSEFVWFIDSINYTSQTWYRYRTRTEEKTYTYYKQLSPWSDWSSTPVEASDNMIVETREKPETDYTLTAGSLDITLEELKAADYQVTIPISTNFDVTWFNATLYLSSDLEYVSAEGLGDTSVVNAVSNKIVSLYMSGQSDDEQDSPAGPQIAVTVKIPESAAIGDAFYIAPSLTGISGTENHFSNTSLEYATPFDYTKNGYIRIVEPEQTTAPIATSTTTTTTTREPKEVVLSPGDISLTLSELQANGYEISVPIYVNKEINSVGLGIWLHDDLEYVKLYTTIDGATALASSNENFIFMPFAYASVPLETISPGQFATLLVTVPDTAKPGDRFEIQCVGEDWDGKPMAWKNGVTGETGYPKGASGYITISPEVTEPPVATSTTQVATSSTGVATSTTTTTTPKAIRVGDVNLDGEIDLSDDILLNKMIIGVVAATDTMREMSDINSNGEVEAMDAILLLKFLVHIIQEIPYQE